MRRRPTSPAAQKSALTHVAPNGSVRMVDVGGKNPTERRAVAVASIVMQPSSVRMILQRVGKKGDVFGVAQIAGIAAAKRTSELIPLCHILPLTHAQVDCSAAGRDRVTVRCAVACVGRTGVEMEALTGAAVAALTVYDMCKAVDRGMRIESLQLEKKSGGRSGTFVRRSRDA